MDSDPDIRTRVNFAGKPYCIQSFDFHTVKEANSFIGAAFEYAPRAIYLPGSLVSLDLCEVNEVYRVTCTFEPIDEIHIPQLREQVQNMRVPDVEFFLERTIVPEKKDVMNVTIYEGNLGLPGLPAIKKCYTDCSLQDVNRVLREALVQRRLKSNYICKLFQCSIRKTSALYEVSLVMERLKGDLAQTIKELKEPLTEMELLLIPSDISEALLTAKMGGISHGDIKTQNVYVANRLDCKLGDFGTAIDVYRSGSQPSPGTMDYLSPEMHLYSIALTEEEAPKVDVFQADVYSLGLVLLETAKRCFPMALVEWDVHSDAERLAAAVEEEVRGLPYSEGVQQLIKEMLQWNPQARPTIEEVCCRVKFYYLPDFSPNSYA